MDLDKINISVNHPGMGNDGVFKTLQQVITWVVIRYGKYQLGCPPMFLSRQPSTWSSAKLQRRCWMASN